MGAERLEFAGKEPIPIAFVWFDVINDGGWDSPTFSSTESTQGFSA
jgi:hypothetical protein